MKVAIATASEQIASGMMQVATGWVILRPNGIRVDDQIYNSEEAARATARCLGNDHLVAAAKRVWTIRRRRPDWVIGTAS